MRFHKHIRRNLILAFLLALVVLNGCQTARFYRQAVRGQWHILVYREPLKDLMTRASTPTQLKEKFRLVLELRAFAERELHLDAKGHYLSYVDLHRPHAVWKVHAAPEFSIESKTWWYPVVGELEYRGYFKEQDARAYAVELVRQGYDACVDPADAYSTLGWFRDPVLSTFIRYSETELAAVLFHELAHQKLFVSGDTDFNEAFATAVEEEGVRRWLAAQGDQQKQAAFERALQREQSFVRLINQARERLGQLYAGLPSSAEKGRVEVAALASQSAARDETSSGRPQLPTLSAARQAKAAVFSDLQAELKQLRQQWGGSRGLDNWCDQPLNNARLNTVDTYYGLVPGFRALLREQTGDLGKFYRAVRRLSKLPEEQRRAALQSRAGE